MPKSKSVDELQEEILQLKQMLKVDSSLNSIADLVAGLNVTKQQAEILLLLYKHRDTWVSTERIEFVIKPMGIEVYASNPVQAQVSKLRKLLGKDTIKSIVGIGYKLTDAGVEKCRKVLEN